MQKNRIVLLVFILIGFFSISIYSVASTKYSTLTLKNVEALSAGESEGSKICDIGTSICVAGGVIYIGKNKK